VEIVKQCAYCGRVYNLLPCVLVTPLYRVIGCDTPKGSAEIDKRATGKKAHWKHAGFRVALKFWRWHLGWEVHYE